MTEIKQIIAEIRRGSLNFGSGERKKLLALADAYEALEKQVHDMCHDLHVTGPVTVEEFCDGCEKFQIEKFGESPITKLKAYIADLHVKDSVKTKEINILTKEIKETIEQRNAWNKLANDRLKQLQDAKVVPKN